MEILTVFMKNTVPNVKNGASGVPICLNGNTVCCRFQIPAFVRVVQANKHWQFYVDHCSPSSFRPVALSQNPTQVFRVCGCAN